jgi:hypothetical protein
MGLQAITFPPETLDKPTPGGRWSDDLDAAVVSADVIVTDAPGGHT